MKTLEEYGIGRPSTYASIISTLQDRGYALLDKKRFAPDRPRAAGQRIPDRALRSLHRLRLHRAHGGPARLHLQRRARMGTGAAGVLERVLRAPCEEKQDVNRGVPARRAVPQMQERCCICRTASAGCSSVAAPIRSAITRGRGATCPTGRSTWARILISGLDVLLMRGPYGFYAQLGPTVEGAQTKPRRASWPQELADRHRRLGDSAEGAVPATHSWTIIRRPASRSRPTSGGSVRT